MLLDTRTLILASLMVCALQGTLAILVAYEHPGTRALKVLGGAMLVLCVGLALQALRSQIPDFLSITVGNGLVGVAALLTLRCVRLFTRSETHDALGWTVLALACLALEVLRNTVGDVRPRIVIASALCTVLLLRIALHLRACAPQQALRASRFTAVLFATWAGIHALRVGLAILGPPQTSYLAPSPLQTLIFVATMALTIMATLGILWMEISRLNEEMRRLATRDSLTGALNRAAFLEACEREISRPDRSRPGPGLVIFDLDHFKPVNDTYGHAAGDAVLCHAVSRLAGSIRAEDVLGRLGGEEFGVLLPGADLDAALQVAERARRELAETPVEVEGRPLRITASGGAASLGGPVWSLSALMRAADSALYRAKAGGRNRIEPAVTVPDPAGPFPRPTGATSRTSISRSA